MTATSYSTAWLGDGELSEAQAGAKARTLSVLLAHGLPVPYGFVVTVDAFQSSSYGSGREARRNLRQKHSEDSLLRGELGADLERSISEYYQELVFLSGSRLVAVRSSAVGEDSVNASFAGQYKTTLNCGNMNEVFNAVLSCWASFSSERVENYRRRLGLPSGRGMGVLIQAMLQPRVAGVLFTRHPVDKRHLYVIEAANGLGSAVVNGARVPEHILVDPCSELRTPDIGRDGLLTHEDTKALVDAGQRIEQVLGYPQDIEWAITDNLHILQARPISTL